MIKNLTLFFLVTVICVNFKILAQDLSQFQLQSGFKIEIFANDLDSPRQMVEGKNGTYYLDPIDLREDFQIEGEQVWFKYGGLRRMNRCEKASPISIIEIIKGN